MRSRNVKKTGSTLAQTQYHKQLEVQQQVDFPLVLVPFHSNFYNEVLFFIFGRHVLHLPFLFLSVLLSTSLWLDFWLPCCDSMGSVDL